MPNVLSKKDEGSLHFLADSWRSKLICRWDVNHQPALVINLAGAFFMLKFPKRLQIPLTIPS